MEGEVGPYPRLATEIAELNGKFKALQNEWLDKETRLDAIVKRFRRLQRVEEDEAPPPQEAPLDPDQQRAQILQKFRIAGG